MARVTVEDCLTHDENRFALVVLAAQRARKLMGGISTLVPSKNRPAVTALREIAAGKIIWDRNVREVVDEFIVDRKQAERI